MKKNKKMIWIAAVILCVAATVYVYEDRAEAEGMDTIYEGLYLEEINLSGLTIEQATEAMQAYAKSVLETPVILSIDEETTVETDLGSLGLALANPEVVEQAFHYGRGGNLIHRFKEIQDLKKSNVTLEMNFSFDEELAESWLTDNLASFDIEAIDAIYERVDGEVQIVPETIGRALNVMESLSTVKKAALTEWKAESISLDMTFDDVIPRGTQEEFAQITDILGTYTTSYKTSAADRSGNVENGASKVNGNFLYPGEEFSAYEAVEPFTYENGYYDAGSYLNGIVVDSIGGGICQVSTTLYNAAIRAELEITQRQPHSMIVTYVPVSADAAIAGTWKDLKFVNNTEHPIYIEGTTVNKKLTFTIYGVDERAENRTITFENKILEETVPADEKIVQTEDSPFGYVSVQSVHVGYRAELWKIVSVDGVETERIKMNESKYNATPRTLVIGVSGASEEIRAALNAAVATGSIEHVRATVQAILATPAP